ncbi:hypothetical protein OG579_03805 [Williamsia herbipolensis]|uniref:Uncharacterized protein n=1 Tax=Williamsia herbipolensis TaxID=1603258 RepID=A0AAU4K4F8_9NOCA|nr:hypothetical protein [Williamsia herbipolensis]
MTENKASCIKAGDLTAEHLLLMVAHVGNFGGRATHTVGVLTGVFHSKVDTTLYLGLSDTVDVTLEVDSDELVQFDEQTEAVLRGAIYAIEND